MSFLSRLLERIPQDRREQFGRPPLSVLKEMLFGEQLQPPVQSPIRPTVARAAASQPPAPQGGTTPEQLEKFWGDVVSRQGGFPMREHIPALIETEKEYDLPGFAKVAALLSQIESSGGHNIPEGTFNPYGLLTTGHGSPAQHFPSIPSATQRLAEEFTRPEGFYKIPRGTTLDLPFIKERIAPRYNVEGGGYWPTFAEWWGALE